MIRAVILDTSPLGLLTRRKGALDLAECQKWIRDHTAAGTRIVVPEVADYEIRREMVRAGNPLGIQRLETFISARADRYLPITTDAMRKAADFWAMARNAGLSTAPREALDCDVVLAGQALTMGLLPSEIIIATENSKHISRYVACDNWRNITP